LNVAKQVPNFHENHFVYENIPILDLPDVELKPYIATASKFIKDVESMNGRVLVHCVAGLLYLFIY